MFVQLPTRERVEHKYWHVPLLLKCFCRSAEKMLLSSWPWGKFFFFTVTTVVTTLTMTTNMTVTMTTSVNMTWHGIAVFTWFHQIQVFTATCASAIEMFVQNTFTPMEKSTRHIWLLKYHIMVQEPRQLWLVFFERVKPVQQKPSSTTQNIFSSYHVVMYLPEICF